MGDADRVVGLDGVRSLIGGREGRLGTSQVCGARQKRGRLLRGSDEDGSRACKRVRGPREQDAERDTCAWLLVREAERERERFGLRERRLRGLHIQNSAR